VRARSTPAVSLAGGASLVVVILWLMVAGWPGGTPAAVAADGAADASGNAPVVRFYYGDGCPYCAQQELYLDAIELERDVVVHRAEVWNDDANRAELTALAAAFGQEVSGVPVTFIGDRMWVGFEPRIAAELTAALDACAVSPCADPLERLSPVDEAPAPAGPPAPEPGVAPGASAVITVPFVGSVDLASSSLFPATVLIGFVDGLNPCSLWVLSILLGLLLRTGSRRRIALVGGTFIGVTALVYGAFIVGVFSALSVVGLLDWVRIAVAAVAITFAVVNIKDYVAFGRGVSFTIPDRFKPRIYRGGRAIIDPTRSLPGVLGATVVLALGVSLVEVPCTAGFPVLWSSLVADAGVGRSEFVALLATYLLIYMLDELILFFAVVTTLQITRFEERHGRLLKLVGGAVMLALGIAMLVSPTVLHDLSGTVWVFGSALLLAGVVHALNVRFGPGLPPSSAGGSAHPDDRSDVSRLVTTSRGRTGRDRREH
jgi:cytochrome c biogenesis protein CcdA/glutaredoxin